MNDVIGYVFPSEAPLAGQTWRLVLTADGRAYPGLTRDPSGPVVCDDANGNTDSTSSGCYRPAVEYASYGSFPGFNVPNSLTSATELCIAVQVHTAGTWRTMTTPAPACASVG